MTGTSSPPSWLDFGKSVRKSKESVLVKAIAWELLEQHKIEADFKEKIEELVLCYSFNTCELIFVSTEKSFETLTLAFILLCKPNKFF